MAHPRRRTDRPGPAGGAARRRRAHPDRPSRGRPAARRGSPPTPRRWPPSPRRTHGCGAGMPSAPLQRPGSRRCPRRPGCGRSIAAAWPARHGP